MEETKTGVFDNRIGINDRGEKCERHRQHVPQNRLGMWHHDSSAIAMEVSLEGRRRKNAETEEPT